MKLESLPFKKLMTLQNYPLDKVILLSFRRLYFRELFSNEYQALIAIANTNKRVV